MSQQPAGVDVESREGVYDRRGTKSLQDEKDAPILGKPLLKLSFPRTDAQKSQLLSSGSWSRSRGFPAKVFLGVEDSPRASRQGPNPMSLH